jgi:conjugal transfer mating pair stabilization protein TraN
MKVCHYVGSHCAGFLCIEKDDVYCCYDSPLARIMQEQIRAQGIDGGWGSAKTPKCGGLMTSQLALVNWDQVDLSEWLGLLAIGGEYPTQRQITIDGLTGSGSQFNFNGDRPDAAQRTLERIEQSGEDLEQLRIQGGLNLWGQGG